MKKASCNWSNLAESEEPRQEPSHGAPASGASSLSNRKILFTFSMRRLLFSLGTLLFLWEDAFSTGRLFFLAVFSLFSSFSYSLFLFSWNHENRSFDAEAGETLEGSFSAISKSNFASKILNTKLELESLRKRDWKTMDIDEKKAKISRKLLKFAKIFAKKITHSQKKSFCKKWRWISSTVNRSGHQDGGYFRDSSLSTLETMR